MTLAEVYASMDKENVQQFLVSPYTAKLPGAMCVCVCVCVCVSVCVCV